MRLINARPETLDAEIDRALAEMAAFTGSDRAYFVMSGVAPRLHLWHRPGAEPPPGWPARAPDLAARIGSGPDGVLLIPCVRRMLGSEGKKLGLELGLGGWACVTGIASDGGCGRARFRRVDRFCPISRRANWRCCAWRWTPSFKRSSATLWKRSGRGWNRACSRRDAWNGSASSPAASRIISTIYWAGSSAIPR